MGASDLWLHVKPEGMIKPELSLDVSELGVGFWEHDVEGWSMGERFCGWCQSSKLPEGAMSLEAQNGTLGLDARLITVWGSGHRQTWLLIAFWPQDADNGAPPHPPQGLQRPPLLFLLMSLSW